MSFSHEVKEELSKLINYKDKQILKAEFLGYILTANSNQKENGIEFVTENEFNIEAFYKILFNLDIESQGNNADCSFFLDLNLGNPLPSLKKPS